MTDSVVKSNRRPKLKEMQSRLPNLRTFDMNMMDEPIVKLSCCCMRLSFVQAYTLQLKIQTSPRNQRRGGR